ncbi:MAG: hypothetical protein HDS65_01745 [Bacteroidales bacterium]|nr:hypothetical protein [Bacteroidales bacterium]
MTTAKNEMYLVGNLQDYGGPFSSLFLDKEDGSLYILIRLADSYLVTAVSSDEITDYMNGRKSLKAILQGKQSSEATLNGKQFLLGQPRNLDVPSVIKDEDVFDPQFCFDKLKLKVFLKRFNAGAYSTSGRVAN